MSNKFHLVNDTTELKSHVLSISLVNDGVRGVVAKTGDSVAMISLQDYLKEGGTADEFNAAKVYFTVRGATYTPYVKAMEKTRDGMFSGGGKASTIGSAFDYKLPSTDVVTPIQVRALAEHIIVDCSYKYGDVELRPNSPDMVRFLTDQVEWRDMITKFISNSENFSQG